MRAAAVLVVLGLAVTSALASTDVVSASSGHTIVFSKLGEQGGAPEFSGCTSCNSLTSQGLNILLQEVLNAGVVGGCSKVCGGLKSKAEKTACTLACTFVGVKEFAKALESADLDPLYFCQLIHLCKIDDNGAGKIASLDISPLSAAQSSTFSAQMQVVVTNHTGAGEFSFDVSGGVDSPSSAGSVFPELAPGSYAVKISIDTTPAQDPTNGPSWVPGVYTVTGSFCMGECGSKHPHSKVFGQTATNFTVTE